MIFGLFKTMYFFILHFEVRNLGSKIPNFSIFYFSSSLFSLSYFLGTVCTINPKSNKPGSDRIISFVGANGRAPLRLDISLPTTSVTV